MHLQKHHQIDYLELPSRSLDKSKKFFSEVFGWSFTDYGQDYSAFETHGVCGGFYRSKQVMDTLSGSALVVIYSNNLEMSQMAVELAGGKISRAIFSFPGGRRFHFIDPAGNEFAIWSE